MFWTRLFHIVLIELSFAVIGFLGFLNRAVISSSAMAWLQGGALVVSFIVWLIEVFWYDKYFVHDTEKAEWEERGSSLHVITTVYFLVAWLMHAIFLLAWIIWIVNYNELSPLNFVHNIGPFIIKLLILLSQFLMIFIMLFFFIYDVRHVRVTRNVRAMGKSLASISSQISSGNSQ